MNILSDCKYTLRLMAKTPGFTALTTLVTAAGIGLSVFLFSMFNTIIFKDLPFENSESLVKINRFVNGAFSWGGLTIQDYQEVRSELGHLAQFGLFTTSSVNAVGKDGARRYNAIFSEANFFDFTHTNAFKGRTFTESETHEGNDNVAVISYSVWQNQYGGTEAFTKESLTINGRPHAIIGVMPEGYVFPERTDVWLPYTKKANQISRSAMERIYGIAQLKTGITENKLNTEMNLVMKRLEQEYPDTNTGVTAKATSFPMEDMEAGIAVVYVLQVSAVLILLLASINVGNLLLSKAIERNKETAIRAALGAPRYRLMQQTLLESLFICLLGGIMGLFLLAWGLEITEATVATFFSDPTPFWWTFGVDNFTVTLFLGALLFTFVTTGVLPAWKSTNADFNAVLRDGTRGAQGKQSNRLNKILVTSEIFISLAILIAAATAVHGAFKTSRADFGAETDNIVVAKIEMSRKTYPTRQDRIEFISKLETLLEQQNGIVEATYMSDLPGEWSRQQGVAIEGHEYHGKGLSTYPKVNTIVSAQEALPKLGIELLNGRYFTSSDNRPNANTFIVTRSFELKYFKNQSAIGKRIKLANDQGELGHWHTIVGVVENTIQGNANDRRSKVPSIFIPYHQEPRFFLTLAVKTQEGMLNFSAVDSSIRSALKFIDPLLPAYKVETYQSALDRTGAPIRFISSIFAIFGIVAVMLSASGIYGVMGNTIRQKTQEIGVKRALGAQDESIIKGLIWNGVKQLLYGGIPGTLAGGAMGWGMSQILGLDNTAMLVLVAIMVTLVSSVVMFAIYIPTRKALTLEPADALRYE